MELIILFFSVLPTIIIVWIVTKIANTTTSKSSKGFGKNYDTSVDPLDAEDAYKAKMHSRETLGGLIGIVIKSDGFCSKAELQLAKKFLNRYYEPFEIRTILNTIKTVFEQNNEQSKLDQYCKWAIEEFSLADRQKLCALFFQIAAIYKIDLQTWDLLQKLMDKLEMSEKYKNNINKKFENQRIYTNQNAQEEQKQTNGSSEYYHYQQGRQSYNQQSQYQQTQSSNNTTSYYKTLELNAGASKEEIKKAYRHLSKRYHPDMTQDESKKQEYAQKFRQINEAYQQLMRLFDF